jgi:hypothetical protein
VIDAQACERAICWVKEKCIQLGEKGAIVELIGIVQYFKPGDGRIELALPRPTAVPRMYDETETSLPKVLLQSYACTGAIFMNVALDIDEKHVAFALLALYARE